MSKAIIRKAYRELQKRGWTQHDYSDESGCVCLAGAVNAAVTGDPQDSEGDGVRKAYLNTLEEIARVIDTKATTRGLEAIPTERKERWGGQMEKIGPDEMFDLRRDAFTNVIATWNDRSSRRRKQVDALFEKLLAEA